MSPWAMENIDVLLKGQGVFKDRDLYNYEIGKSSTRRELDAQNTAALKALYLRTSRQTAAVTPLLCGSRATSAAAGSVGQAGHRLHQTDPPELRRAVTSSGSSRLGPRTTTASGDPFRGRTHPRRSIESGAASFRLSWAPRNHRLHRSRARLRKPATSIRNFHKHVKTLSRQGRRSCRLRESAGIGSSSTCSDTQQSSPRADMVN